MKNNNKQDIIIKNNNKSEELERTNSMDGLYQTQRIKDLKDKMLSEPRYASIEQALIITKTYQENEDDPRIIQRAKALKAALEEMEIRVEPDELIVGNRTAGVRYGVVLP